MVNKRGWVRAAEASIASVMIIAFVTFLLTNNSINTKESDLDNQLRLVLQEMGENITIRESIVHNDPDLATKLNDFIESRISTSFYGFKVVVCDASEGCLADTSDLPSENSVYIASRIFSSLNDGTISPRKVKVYAWEKG